MIVEIADLNAQELDVYARLTQPQLRADGLFVAESVKVISYALDAGCVPVSFLMEPRRLEYARCVTSRCPDTPVYTAPREVLQGLTGYALTRGVLCAMRRPPMRDAMALCADARRIAVLENVNDPTNMGAILRAAAGLGVDAVLLSPGCCDPLARRSARVSMGAALLEPWARVNDWPGALDNLHALGFKLCALALTEDSLPIDAPVLADQPRLAILLGAEGDGLAPQTIAACDFTAKIPMSRGMDSLNVAAAAAVAFWNLRAT